MVNRSCLAIVPKKCPEFNGAFRVDVPPSPCLDLPQIEVWRYSNTTLQLCFSQIHRCWVYLWGKPIHPKVNSSELPEWCSKVVTEGSYERIKELMGTFVIIIDEPVKKTVTFVSDVLGVRPMFIACRENRLVFGSQVWPLFRAGLVSGRINYDAVSSWISYGFSCSSKSLFAELLRLAPGSALIWKDGQFEEIPYARFAMDGPLANVEQMAEELHEIISSTVEILLRDTPQATLALSGGYDSRYLLALSLASEKSTIQCASVNISSEEVGVAQRVAYALKVPLVQLAKPGSEWDLYDDVFHFSADGFPISKMLTYCIAKQYPQIPMINGYLGDSLIRGSKDTFLGKYEDEWKEDLVSVLQKKYSFVSSEMFSEGIAERIQERSRLPMEEAVKKGASMGKVFGWADFYFRQRLYISNNFLQHLDLTEAILPFYSWALLSFKMRHDDRMFNKKLYEQIFSRYFPAISEIPHSDSLLQSSSGRYGVARCSVQWARQLLPIICQQKRLSLLKKQWCIPRCLVGCIGLPRLVGTLYQFRRLWLLEEQARAYGLNFDWEQI